MKKFFEWLNDLKFEGVDPKHHAYAQRYFQKNSPRQKAAIQQLIADNAKTGVINTFVDMNGMTEEDKEKLSAYIVAGDEIGYEVGPWTYNRSGGTGSAQAPIKYKLNK